MNPSSNDNPGTVVSKKAVYAKLPSSVWVLGFVSLLMDTSSELVHSLLPIFMTSVLGASMITVGIIEGIAEATAAFTKVFSGVLSDYFRKRKIIVLLGYSLAAITKPVFPLATTISAVFTARFIDRIGKGIRGAPRDALIADITPPQIRGAAYGLRQALDSVGAFIGPVLAVLFMIIFSNDITVVLWIAVIPAFLAVFLLMTAVKEPATTEHHTKQGNQPILVNVKLLSHRYWFVVALGAVFSLARFSEAFLILRAQDIGLAISYIPAIMIVMNIIYAMFAYPAGAIADRVSARLLLVYGLALLVVADVILVLTSSVWLMFLAAALWGLHMALTQGLLAKLVADTAPANLRGTAFGIFNMVSGGALLVASIIAGSLWDTFGAAATFGAGAVFATLTVLGLLLYQPRV